VTPTPFTVHTIELDLPALAGAFSARLHAAGLAVTPERSAQLARALTLAAPSGPSGLSSRGRLYWTARAVIVTDRAQVRAFDAVFAEVFGDGRARSEVLAPDAQPTPTAADERPAGQSPQTAPPGASDEPWTLGSGPSSARSRRESEELQVPVPTIASDEEVIRTKRFDALDADELTRLYALMRRLSLATPERLTRRRRGARHGARVDLRRTLRASLRTGGDPIRLARRRRRVQRRRLVLLCDISGSMEPYSRAYLQFLTCAVCPPGGHTHATANEAFVFATRLTRLTRALRWAGGRSPERAIAQAAVTAPDWSSGTRIGDALKTFNDRHGRRGIARGAIVVILSDGWERGDPSLVGREMERLSRLAHRIVWVNPRVAAAGFSPRVGGMAAALPYCDALVSGHNLQSLEAVADAIGAERPRRRPIGSAVAAAAEDPDTETWASATPVPGSSVAMPSGYGPGRGRTTPGWG
jgi:uncharacterized protein with von Willebrand factor type A (vWA) domain